MVDETYFFDSYAVFEMLEGNPNYEEYEKSLTVLTKLNLFEIHYGILKEKGKEKAKEILENFSESVVDFTNEDIINASEIKKQNPRRSMTDCIGYIVSIRLKIKFLTGDKEFEDLNNVEFVK
jgi:predicted nucleic acid-binding protein